MGNMENIIRKGEEYEPFLDQLLRESEAYFMQLEPPHRAVSYQSFYDAFAQPYFGCFHCDETRAVLDLMDLDADDKISWEEWRFWLTWAFREFPHEVKNMNDMTQVVFRHGLVPL